MNRIRSATVAALVAALASSFAAAASAQGIPPATPSVYPSLSPSCPELVIAFVDPITGVDPVPSNPYTWLNNPRKPFRTIQAAIDGCQMGVIAIYNDPTVPNHLQAQGVVYCQPGLYGPTGVQAGPKDGFSITVRDRVALQGQGARRTILRGDGSGLQGIFWPDVPICGSDSDREVLLNCSNAHDFEPNPQLGTLPWQGNGDSEEMIDGFTFRGGDVHIYALAEGPIAGRVSNCIFDLRGDTQGLTGPSFGMLLVSRYDLVIAGYHPMPFNTFNNTFLFGETTPAGVDALIARPEAVGICAVNDPVCGLPEPPEKDLIGVSGPSIQNNLFRTLPGQGNFPLLGLASADVSTLVGSSPGLTNAFAGSNVGPSNGTFFAFVAAVALPAPAVDLNTAGQPLFVGEGIAGSIAGFEHYRDWRMIPGSSLEPNPFQDAGSGPAGGGTLMADNLTTFFEPSCEELRSFDWDGEAYGNPRLVDEVDIGFDEVHLMISAGHWANDTNNHNDPDPVIDPNGGQGAWRRFLLFPDTFVGADLTVHGTQKDYLFLGPSIVAWLSQPGTLRTPEVDPSLPAQLPRQVHLLRRAHQLAHAVDRDRRPQHRDPPLRGHEPSDRDQDPGRPRAAGSGPSTSTPSRW